MTIKTQVTRAPDAAALAAMHRACFAVAWDASAIRDLLAIQGTVALTAFSGPEPAGFALLRHLGEDAEILTLAVPPPSRRKGVGRALVAAMLACAKEQSVQKLFLEVRQSNKAALALYEAMGFTALSRRRGYYRNEDGSREDALILQCAVDS